MEHKYAKKVKRWLHNLFAWKIKLNMCAMKIDINDKK